MNYLFDSSGVFIAIKRRATNDFLVGNSTISLARYELGNILFVEYHVLKHISKENLDEFIQAGQDSFKLLDVFTIEGYEKNVLDVATKFNLSFYDASYVYFAKKMNVPLVTADGKLKRKAGKYDRILTPDEFLAE